MFFAKYFERITDVDTCAIKAGDLKSSGGFEY
jgi:hypothetical protein